MDYAPIQTFLVGRCGKTMRDAAMTSADEYELLAEGYASRDREEWEKIRWMVFMQWCISPNLKRRPDTPQEIIRFPWEKKSGEIRDAEPLSESEIMGLCNLFGISREKITNG